MERFFTIFWLFLIPTQLGRHFWLSESSVLGIRIDYLSIILYLTDLVWLGWVGMKVRKEILDSRHKKILNSKLFNFKNLILLLLVGVNIILAPAKVVAIYRWLRIGQWGLTWKLVAKNKGEIKKYLKWIVPGWIILESFLGLAQIAKGGSLNGIWWWLGERRFMYGGIGIAQFSFLGEGWIRAYGTFSHPNSLAGFLLLAWWWWRKENRDEKGEFFRVWYWVVNWSAVLGIVLAGSRVVWMLTVLLLVVEQILNNKRESLKRIIGKILLYVGIICLILGAISVNYRLSDFVGGWDINSLKKREMLGISALKMIKRSPLFGLGAGNFVVNLPNYPMGNFYWMQPVHNIFLLAWSEIGALGIIVLILIFQSTLAKIVNVKYWWLWVIVGITGMFDHYWLTLAQNSWLLAIILGMI